MVLVQRWRCRDVAPSERKHGDSMMAADSLFMSYRAWAAVFSQTRQGTHDLTTETPGARRYGAQTVLTALGLPSCRYICHGSHYCLKTIQNFNFSGNGLIIEIVTLLLSEPVCWCRRFELFSSLMNCEIYVSLHIIACTVYVLCTKNFTRILLPCFIAIFVVLANFNFSRPSPYNSSEIVVWCAGSARALEKGWN